MGRKGTLRAGDKVWAASSTLRKLKGKLLADAGQSVEGELLEHANGRQVRLFSLEMTSPSWRCPLALPLGAAPWRCPLPNPLPNPCLPVRMSVCVSAALRRTLGCGFGLRRALLRLWAAALAVALGCGFGLWWALLLPTPFPSAPTWCLGHHHLPVLLFLLPRVRRYAVVPVSDDATRRL